MARTAGHGNPHWTREEVILALALFLECEDALPGPRDPRVVMLSEQLRRNPLHVAAARKPTFRNPAGVAFKLQNLRNVAIGKGLNNTSRMDEAIWKEFGRNKERVEEIAKLIRAQIDGNAKVPDYYEDEEFAEGRLITRAHQMRERSAKLRATVLRNRRGAGALQCDICGIGSQASSPNLEDAIFEVHHILPLSDLGERRTRTSDVALLCANCHRLIHRLIASLKRWVFPGEVASLLHPNQEVRFKALAESN